MLSEGKAACASVRTLWEHGRGELLQSALVQRRLEEASALFQLSSEKNLRPLLPLPSISSGEIGSTEHGVYLAPPPYSEDPKCQGKKRTDQWSRPEWEDPPPPVIKAKRGREGCWDLIQIWRMLARPLGRNGSGWVSYRLCCFSSPPPALTPAEEAPIFCSHGESEAALPTTAPPSPLPFSPWGVGATLKFL